MRVPAKLAFLGEALDMVVELDGVRTTVGWKSRHWLCTDEGKRTLWIFPAPRKKGRPVEAGEEKDLAGVIRLWSQFEPTTLTPVIHRLGTLKRRGDCVSVAYRSDKWTGRFDDYEHAFDRPARVVQAGGLYRLAGPSLRVTAAGIRG